MEKTRDQFSNGSRFSMRQVVALLTVRRPLGLVHSVREPPATVSHFRPWRYSLGSFESQPITFNLLVDLDVAEYASLEESIAAISSLKPSFTYRPVERYFADFSGIHDPARVTLTLGRKFAEAGPCRSCCVGRGQQCSQLPVAGTSAGGSDHRHLTSSLYQSSFVEPSAWLTCSVHRKPSQYRLAARLEGSGFQFAVRSSGASIEGRLKIAMYA